MDKNEKDVLKRNLSFSDLLFAGYSFIIGAGIFTLLPYIIGYSKGYSWLAFILGIIISILTGLSFARLNFEYPHNEAEYSWILNILGDKNSPPTSNRNRIVKILANIVIGSVMLLCVFAGATVTSGIKDIIASYKFGINNYILCFIILLIPTISNIIGTESTNALNKLIMIVITVSFLLVMGIALVYNKFFSNNKFIPTKMDDLPGIVKGSFLSIFAFNGFQSVVQMSEEAKNRSDIPKGIISSISISGLLYIIVTISVITIIGVSNASKSIYPFSKAFSVLPFNKEQEVVNVLSILCMFGTLLMMVFSSSRLLQKLSKLDLAPKYLKKLSGKNKMPISAIITYSILSFIMILIGKGLLEKLAIGSNIMVFFIFTCVNLLCVINYYKKKKSNEKLEDNDIKGFINMYPWYGILGSIISFIFLLLSPNYLKDLK